MKKHFLVYLFAALTMGSMVTSCSDNDDPIVCPIEATTFNTSNGLELTYSGASLLGKQVVFTPNAEDGTKATLVLSGNKFTAEGMPFELPGNGVIPGEETTTLNVENMIINGDAVSFEGENIENGRTIIYKGSANKSGMKLNLDVKMPVNDLAGKTFNLVAYNSKEGKTPITMDWVSDAKFPFLGQPYDVHSLLFMVQMVELVEVEPGKKVTLAAALNSVLSNVTFLADGNIQAQYKDTPADQEWKTSPLNFANYIMGADGKLRLFINAEQILAFEQDASRAGFADIIPALVKEVSRLMVEGVPVTVKEENGLMQFYLDQETLLPILNLLKPLLEDKETVKQLTAMLANVAGPEMAPLVTAIVGPLLESLPKIMEQTTMMHFGINTVVQ